MTPHPPITRIYGIVPAAGLGRRMGLPKQVLPFRRSTIVGNLVRTLLDAELDGIVVVTRSELVQVLDLPIGDRLRVAINDDAASQMIDSIRLGLSTWLDNGVLSGASDVDNPSQVDGATEGTGILVVPGDMPGLSVATCRLCMNAFREAPTSIVVGTHAGQRGHPLIFPASLRADVKELQGGLNLLVERFSDRVRPVETHDPGAVEDVDTWEQYRSQAYDPVD